MDAKQRWLRAAATLESALDLPAGHRASFIRDSCAGDPALEAEVVALLAAHEQSSRFLDGSALAVVGDADATTGPVSPSPSAPIFAAGHTVGRYRIDRLIGVGGMGEVYAAEDIGHGRRVALKVMKQRFPSAEARDRFLEEGRLASAVNHPNIVYVFGSEIIAHHPVIVMELLDGGTLKDRVRREGPLPTARAVDAILQVVDGLEAANAGGIVHRDVKPGNCFVDRDGTVKVGDFGVSVATGAELTRHLSTSTLQVTPQYVAPEQLTGAEPNVRADLYATGATLFYLLTGQAPFDDPDLLVLLTRVQTEPARSPRALVASVPRGLATIVQRCLAKDPGARHPTYAALRASLLPFRSDEEDTVRLTSRFAAAVLDQVAVLLLAAAVTVLAFVIRGPLSSRTLSAALYAASMAGYFLATERRGAGSPGKRLYGLCVVDQHGGAPSIGQSAMRTGLFVFVATLPFLPPLDSWARLFGQTGLPPSRERAEWLANVSMIVSIAGRLVPLLLFATARPWNRWAGLHELLSGTRVAPIVASRTISIAPLAQRTTRTTGAATALGSSGRRGPFVLGAAWPEPDGTTIWGAFDPALERDVWVRAGPESTLSSRARRELSRRCRLRWLAGQPGGDAWEAFDAPPGAALQVAASRRWPWSVVRAWLADLAGELAACEASGEVIPFTLDHVWITTAGHVMLLDFPAPGRQGASAPRSPQQLLRDVAWTALVADRSGEPRRLDIAAPPAGMALLQALQSSEPVDTRELLRLAQRAREGATEVPWWTRAAPVVAAFVLFCGIAVAGASIGRVAGQPLLVGVGSDDFALFNALVTLDAFDRAGIATTPRRDAFEVYIARRYEGLATRAAGFIGLMAPYRSKAADVADRHPPRPGDLETALERLGRAEVRALNATPRPVMPAAVITSVLTLPLIAAVGALSVVLAVVLRGGFLFSLLRLVVADQTGNRVTRARAGARALVAWAPVLALAPMRDQIVRAMVLGELDGWLIAGGLLTALIAASASVALVWPGYGVPEHVSRTRIWPVGS